MNDTRLNDTPLQEPIGALELIDYVEALIARQRANPTQDPEDLLDRIARIILVNQLLIEQEVYETLQTDEQQAESRIIIRALERVIGSCSVAHLNQNPQGPLAGVLTHG